MRTRRNAWTVQAQAVDGPCEGQWVTVHQGTRFADAIRWLTPDRRILRNGKVLRPRHVEDLVDLFHEVNEQDDPTD